MTAREKTGYKRPPIANRFQPGQSGNPKGRPKKHSTIQSDLAAELREKITINEGGRSRKVSKQRALFKTLTTAALKQDIRAVNALLACIRLFGIGEHLDEPAPTRIDPDDLAAIERYLVQERSRTVSGDTNDNRHAGKSKRKGRGDV